jgi:hypothetical protein
MSVLLSSSCSLRHLAVFSLSDTLFGRLSSMNPLGSTLDAQREKISNANTQSTSFVASYYTQPLGGLWGIYASTADRQLIPTRFLSGFWGFHHDL